MRFMLILLTLTACYLRSLPLAYRSPLGALEGRGGGRIFINQSWVDVTRRQLHAIVAELTHEEARRINQALLNERRAEAQDILAAAAIRYFRAQGHDLLA